MTSPNTLSAFALRATGVALAAGLSAAMGAAAAGLGAYTWLVAGWLAAAIPGVAGGTWLAAKFGRPDSGVFVALGVSMAVRAVALAAGLMISLRLGAGAPAAFLLGFSATFVPLAVFEAVWFARRAAKPAER